MPKRTRAVAESEDEDEHGERTLVEETEASGTATPTVEIDELKLAQMVTAGIMFSIAQETTKRVIKKQEFKKQAMQPYISKVTTPLYKMVFDSVQEELRVKYGMELVALPPKEVPEVLQTAANTANNNNKKSRQEGQLEEEHNADAFVMQNIMPSAFRSIINKYTQPNMLEYDAVREFVVMCITFNTDSVIARDALQEIYEQAGLEKLYPFDDLITRLRKERYAEVKNIQYNEQQSVAKLHLLPRAKVEYNASTLLRSYERVVTAACGPEAFNTENEQKQRELIALQLEQVYSS